MIIQTVIFRHTNLSICLTLFYIMWSVHFDICTSDIYCDKKVKWLGGIVCTCSLVQFGANNDCRRRNQICASFPHFVGLIYQTIAPTYDIFSSWLFGFCVFRRYTSPKMSTVGRKRVKRNMCTIL